MPPSVGLKTSAMAVWSLILGFLGLVTCGICSVVGLILGISGLKQVKERPYEYKGSGFAVGGIVVSSISLLVVLLMVPAAILFPVFARSREAARKSKCLNNLKQLSQALRLYSDDYDSVLPSSGVTGISSLDFCSRASISGSYPPNSAVRQTWPQLLYDNMKDPDIIMCPSDKTWQQAGYPAGMVTSYWYKYANDLAWTSRGRQKMSDYGFEADQLAFFEHRALHFGDESGLKQGAMINVCFIDTHCETIVLPSDGTAPPPGAPINDPAGMKGPYEPFYYNTCFSSGSATPVTSKGGLSPDRQSGKCIDPTSNYDTF